MGPPRGGIKSAKVAPTPELAGSLKLLPRLLDKPASAAAALCGDLGGGGTCGPTRKVLQTNDWAREDPGWCQLAEACASAARSRIQEPPPAVCCHTRRRHGARRGRACARDPPLFAGAFFAAYREEEATCDTSCPEAARIAAIRNGRVGKRELEFWWWRAPRVRRWAGATPTTPCALSTARGRALRCAASARPSSCATWGSRRTPTLRC